MDYRLLFTQRALNDLALIVAHVAEDDGGAASRFGEGLPDQSICSGASPRVGNVVSKRSSVRKLVHSPILVYYQIHEAKGRVSYID